MFTWFVRSAVLALVLTGVSSASGSNRTIVYVNAAAGAGGNGTSWSSAFRDLQDALAGATSNTDIWVAQGVYRPDRGANQRGATFMVPAGTHLYGGFIGGETSVNQRDLSVRNTVLSGDIGVPGDNTDNSFHVVRFMGGAAAPKLDGLVVTGGRADGAAYPDDSGGGILSDGVTPTIVSCTVVGNTAKFGGGVFAKSGAVTVIASDFRSNTGLQDGGAIVARSGGLIRGATFVGNNAVFGGAIMCCCGPMRIESSVFRANHANKGGGLFTAVGALTVANSEFFSNSAIEGGGLYTSASGYGIKNCRFGANSAQLGGGLQLIGAGTVANCTFVRNFASASGGGTHSTQASSLVNNTFYANSALIFGGGLHIVQGSPTVRNSIFWANNDSTGQSQSAQISRASGTPSIAYNCVQGWSGTLGGVGNFAASPGFVDPAGPDGIPGTADDDLRLCADSPCIDAGDYNSLPADLADLNNNGNTVEILPLDLDMLDRVVRQHETANTGVPGPGSNDWVDLGAYEFHTALCVGDANGDLVINGGDLSVLLYEFGSDGLAPYAGADMNGDGIVNGQDLSVLLSRFGDVCAGAAVTP